MTPPTTLTRRFRFYLLWCLFLLLAAGWADHHGYSLVSDDEGQSAGNSGGTRGPTHK